MQAARASHFKLPQGSIPRAFSRRPRRRTAALFAFSGSLKEQALCSRRPRPLCRGAMPRTECPVRGLAPQLATAHGHWLSMHRLPRLPGHRNCSSSAAPLPAKESRKSVLPRRLPYHQKRSPRRLQVTPAIRKLQTRSAASLLTEALRASTVQQGLHVVLDQLRMERAKSPSRHLTCQNCG